MGLEITNDPIPMKTPINLSACYYKYMHPVVYMCLHGLGARL